MLVWIVKRLKVILRVLGMSLGWRLSLSIFRIFGMLCLLMVIGGWFSVIGELGRF